MRSLFIVHQFLQKMYNDWVITLKFQFPNKISYFSTMCFELLPNVCNFQFGILKFLTLFIEENVTRCDREME